MPGGVDRRVKQGAARWFAANIWTLSLLMALVYFLSGNLSFALSYDHSIVTIVIFAAEGFALAAALIFGKRILPGIFLGQFALGWYNGLALDAGIAVSTVNTLEALIAIMLFRRFRLGREMDNTRDLTGLMLLIVLVLQPFSATLGTLSLVFSGQMSLDNYFVSWFSWWFGNAMGQILITPMLLAFYAGSFKHKWLDLGFTMTLSGLLGYLLTLYEADFTIVLMLAITTPLVILIAAKKGLAQAGLAVNVLTLVILYQTFQGVGPFKEGSFTQLIELNYFVLSLILLALILGVLFAERRKSEDMLSRLAMFDALTGLFNRNALRHKIVNALARGWRHDKLVAVCFIDLDGFKEVNDHYGHEVGDFVLKKLSRRLREITRCENAVIRQGGDEFISIVEDIDTVGQLKPYLDRVLEQMAKAVLVSSHSIKLSSSIGVAVYPLNGTDPEALVRLADQAMYQAKQAGRNRVKFA